MKTKLPMVIFAALPGILAGCDTTVESNRLPTPDAPDATVTTGRGWNHDETQARPTERIGPESAVRPKPGL